MSEKLRELVQDFISKVRDISPEAGRCEITFLRADDKFLTINFYKKNESKES
jgi:hypothetical protein